MARYSVGQQLPVVFVKRGPKQENNVTCNLLFIPFSPAFDEVNPDVEVATMTVKEHHQVPWDQDSKDKKEYDGFVLEDAKGAVWHNQYPAASYGQLSDIDNAVFEKALASKEAVNQFLQDNPYGCAQGILATRYLDDLDRVLTHMEQYRENPGVEDNLVRTRAHYADVMSTMKDQLGVVISRNPLKMGDNIIKDMYRHVVVSGLKAD